MKKRVYLLISALVLVLSLSGCGNQTQKSPEYDQDAMEQVADFMISNMAQMDETTFENFRRVSDYAIDKTLYEAGLPLSAEDFVGILDVWEASAKEYGAYKDHGDWTVEISNTKVKVKTQAQFENTDVSLEFIFNERENLQGLAVGGKYTTDGIWDKIGANPVIGIGIAAAVLIIISFLVFRSRDISAVRSQDSQQEAKGTITKTQVQEAAVLTDDLELVAVISAAIAQAEGVAPEGFVVRSIKRRITNKWNGGR